MAQSVIFLEIEGVLVHGQQERAAVREGIATELAILHNNPVIARLSDDVVTQILASFSMEACQMLNRLCEEKDAHIVLSSSWRLLHSLEELQAIFQILGIHHLKAALPAICVRRDAIAEYVRKHDIESFIVLDDIDLKKAFGYRFIQCTKGLTLREFEQASSALKCQRKTFLNCLLPASPAELVQNALPEASLQAALSPAL